MVYRILLLIQQKGKCGRLCWIITIHCKVLIRANPKDKLKTEECEIRGASIQTGLHPLSVSGCVRMEIFLQTSFILHSMKFHPGDICYFPTQSRPALQAFQMLRNVASLSLSDLQTGFSWRLINFHIAY